jgi:hypothetical protein
MSMAVFPARIESSHVCREQNVRASGGVDLCQSVTANERELRLNSRGNCAVSETILRFGPTLLNDRDLHGDRIVICDQGQLRRAVNS